jgi:hypothetical protein
LCARPTHVAIARREQNKRGQLSSLFTRRRERKRAALEKRRCAGKINRQLLALVKYAISVGQQRAPGWNTL